MQNRAFCGIGLEAALVALGMGIWAFAGEAFAREFTDSKGRVIEAEITGATLDGQVEILRAGKKVMAPINLFSPDDQVYIRDWIQANPEAVTYRFRYFADVDEMRTLNTSKDGRAISDKLKIKPQRLLINVTNNNPAPVTDLRVVAHAVVEDAVNTVNGSYVKLAVGYKKKDVVQVQRIRAEKTFPVLAAQGRAELTFEFDIESYVDRDGSRVDGAAADRVLGAWVRVYKGAKMIGEYKRGLHSNFEKVTWVDKGSPEPRNVETKVK